MFVFAHPLLGFWSNEEAVRFLLVREPLKARQATLDFVSLNLTFRRSDSSLGPFVPDVIAPAVPLVRLRPGGLPFRRRKGLVPRDLSLHIAETRVAQAYVSQNQQTWRSGFEFVEEG